MRRYAVGLAVLLLTVFSQHAESYVTFGKSWPNLLVGFYVNTDHSPVSPERTIEIFKAVATAWATAAPNAHIKAYYVGTTTATPGACDGRNVFGFVPGTYPDDGRIAHTTWPCGTPTTNKIAEADTMFYLDTQYSWFDDGQQCGGEGVYIQDVATHEYGHFLGLDHTPVLGDSTATRPTMFTKMPSYCGKEWRTPEQDDIDGLTALYPGPYVYTTTRVTAGFATTDTAPVAPSWDLNVIVSQLKAYITPWNDWSWRQIKPIEIVASQKWRHIPVTLRSCNEATEALKLQLINDGFANLGTTAVVLSGGPCNPHGLSTAMVFTHGVGPAGHELGHSAFGLGHAGAWVCNVPAGQTIPVCSIDGYGDYFSVMGGNWSGHPAPAQSEGLGWLTAGGLYRFNPIVNSGRYVLERYDTLAKGVKALRMTFGSRVYYVIYRGSYVTVYRGVNLMDLDQKTTANKRAITIDGDRFSNFDDKFSVVLVSHSQAGATVDVTMPGDAPAPQPQPEPTPVPEPTPAPPPAPTPDPDPVPTETVITDLSPENGLTITNAEASTTGIATRVTATNAKSALMHWIWNGADQAYQCAKSGDTYSYTIKTTSGPGTRSWYMEIRTNDGRAVKTSPRQIVVK